MRARWLADRRRQVGDVKSAAFPVGIALGATCNPDLLIRIGVALAGLVTSKGAHVLLAPTVNRHRIQTNGRNFECNCEDPALTAQTVAVVRNADVVVLGVGREASWDTEGADLRCIALSVAGDQVSVSVANTGTRDGLEVVQLYVSPPLAPLDRPRRELPGFAKVMLKAGAQRRVRLSLTDCDFAGFCTAKAKWIVEPGPYGIEAGVSAENLPL